MMASLVTSSQTLTGAPTNVIYLVIELDEILDERFSQSKCSILIIGLKSHANLGLMINSYG